MDNLTILKLQKGGDEYAMGSDFTFVKKETYQAFLASQKATRGEVGRATNQPPNLTILERLGENPNLLEIAKSPQQLDAFIDNCENIMQKLNSKQKKAIETLLGNINQLRSNSSKDEFLPNKIKAQIETILSRLRDFLKQSSLNTPCFEGLEASTMDGCGF